MGNKLFKPKQPNENGFFLQGPQGFEYDTSKPLFEKKNGLLFRLVNTQGKQWAYYNDTKKYEFHITVTFSPKCSNLVALGKTSLAPLAEGGWVATNVIYPDKTEPFVQGDIAGFDARISALLLTTEYQERRKSEKAEEKRAKKHAERNNNNGNNNGNNQQDSNDELDSVHERS